jgi:hypothetical protein
MTPEQASTFGVPMGTQTANQQWQQWQMQNQAARMSGGGGGSHTGNEEIDSYIDHMLAMGDDVRAFEWLLRQGFNQGMIDLYINLYNDAKESRASQGAGQGAGQIDWQSVNNLGYGPISQQELNRLLESGEIIGRNINGRIVFERAPRMPQMPGVMR